MSKLLFFIKRPPVILVTGKARALAKQAISQVLEPGALIFESDLLEAREVEKFSFLLRRSKLPILVLTNIEDGNNVLQIGKLAKVLPARGFLILNFDDETSRGIKNESLAHSLTYGFQERADLKVADINVSQEGTNFKIDYQGNIVPFWLRNLFGKEQIYSALAAIAVGIIKEINLVEISQLLSKN